MNLDRALMQIQFALQAEQLAASNTYALALDAYQAALVAGRATCEQWEELATRYEEARALALQFAAITTAMRVAQGLRPEEALTALARARALDTWAGPPLPEVHVGIPGGVPPLDVTSIYAPPEEAGEAPMWHPWGTAPTMPSARTPDATLQALAEEAARIRRTAPELPTLPPLPKREEEGQS